VVDDKSSFAAGFVFCKKGLRGK